MAHHIHNVSHINFCEPRFCRDGVSFADIEISRNGDDKPICRLSLFMTGAECIKYMESVRSAGLELAEKDAAATAPIHMSFHSVQDFHVDCDQKKPVTRLLAGINCDFDSFILYHQ